MEAADVSMADVSLAPSIAAAVQSSKSRHPKHGKARELFSCTISQPPFAYAQVEMVTSSSPSSHDSPIDAIQARAYCDAALKQFLGATGAAMPLDLLRIQGRQFWVRLPREDLGLFAGALAAWCPVSSSSSRDGATVTTALRLRQSGNWLGSLVGRDELPSLWTGS